jgi:hypothetical protein
MDAAKGIVERVCAVMADVGNVEKDKTNAFHNYKYTSAEAVKAKVQKACARHGVMLRLTYSEESVSPQQSVMKATCAVSCDGVTWVMLGEGWGAGIDKGEKSPMKACTSSTKYALANAFCIALGDDPEDDAETDRDAERGKRSTPATRQKSEPANGNGRIHAELGDEEAARAAAQGEVARGLADKLINDFRALTGTDETSIQDAARNWISANAGAADALGEVERKRIAKALYTYVGSGVIEGMNAEGFKDEWTAAISASRVAAGSRKRGA